MAPFFAAAMATGFNRRRSRGLALAGIGLAAALVAAWKAGRNGAFVGVASEEPAEERKPLTPCERVAAKAFKTSFHEPLMKWRKALTESTEKCVRNFGKSADQARAKTLASFDALERETDHSCERERNDLDTAMTMVIKELFLAQAQRVEKRALVGLQNQLQKKMKGNTIETKIWDRLVTRTCDALGQELTRLEPALLKGLADDLVQMTEKRIGAAFTQGAADAEARTG